MLGKEAEGRERESGVIERASEHQNAYFSRRLRQVSRKKSDAVTAVATRRQRGQNPPLRRRFALTVRCPAFFRRVAGRAAPKNASGEVQ